MTPPHGADSKQSAPCSSSTKFQIRHGDFNVDSRTIDYLVSIVDIFQSIVFTRSPLAAPIGDSWKLDPRWDQCCELVGIFPYCGKIEDPWGKGNFSKNMGISGNGTLYLVDLLQ